MTAPSREKPLTAESACYAKPLGNGSPRPRLRPAAPVAIAEATGGKDWTASVDRERGAGNGKTGLCEVALIGGINMDRIARGHVALRPDTSTPGTIEVRPGGVAANVARVLARLGLSAALAGRLGEDSDGRALRDGLSALGIDLAAVRASDKSTASYLALHDPDGSLAAALVDAAITEEIGPADFSPLPPALHEARWWFLDANLAAQTLDRLCTQAAGHRLAADAVSIAKAPRLGGCLTRLDLIFANRQEARAMLRAAGAPVGPQDASAESLAQALCAAGAEAAVVTDGADGLASCDGNGANRLAALPAHTRDVTGAGDALIGATLAGLVHGLALDQALRRGLAAAAIVLEHAGSADEALSARAIDRRLDARADATLDK